MRGEYENDPESVTFFSRVGGSWEGFFWEHLVRIFSIAVCAANEARNSINEPSRNGLINTNVTASDTLGFRYVFLLMTNQELHRPESESVRNDTTMMMMICGYVRLTSWPTNNLMGINGLECSGGPNKGPPPFVFKWTVYGGV